MTTDDKLAVSQADRELWKWLLDAPYATCTRINNLPDDCEELQKIARHRLSGEAQARAAGERAGLEKAAAWLKADAKRCDCSALEDRECACGAWDDYKTVAMTDLIDRFETECIRAAPTPNPESNHE